MVIIPARGGSKRIPKKNIVDFLGRPLIAWTIDAALQSQVCDDVIVSTDSEELGEVALKFGAQVPFLRNTHADDFSTVSEATVAALEALERAGRTYDTVVQLLPVCPLRSAASITSALAFFNERGAEFVISCTRFGWTNPWWAATLDDRGRPVWLHPQALGERSQALPALYAPSGAIWIAKVSALMKSRTFYGPDHLVWELPWAEAIDIDTAEDLELGRILAAHRMQRLAAAGAAQS